MSSILENFPQHGLIGDSIVLRKWSISDANDLYEYASQEGVGEFAGWAPHKSIEESKKVIHEFIKNEDVLAIALKESNKVIGSVGAHETKLFLTKHLNNRILGIVINPKYQMNGYAKEAVELLEKFLFDVCKVAEIWGAHFSTNTKMLGFARTTCSNFVFAKLIDIPQIAQYKVECYYYCKINKQLGKQSKKSN